MAAAMTHTFW